MSAGYKRALLRAIAAACQTLNRQIIFRRAAQDGHDDAIRLLRLLDGLPLSSTLASALHHATFEKTHIEVGGLRLSQRLILAAGLVKGDGFADEAEAMRAAADARRNIIPGWRIVPALAGPVEFGSFTRRPRMGNKGDVVWRREATRSTQNRVGLRNPGARAAAAFLGARRGLLPQEYGINIALSPGVEDIDEQTRDVVEALSFFLDADVHPTWFTLNISCPNTEDDPQGNQIEAETELLCGAFVASLRARNLAAPLWVKISPKLKNHQYRKLMRACCEVGVNAVVATNTLAQPSPTDDSLQAGVGGGDLRAQAMKAVELLLAEKNRKGYDVDVIACGGILDGESLLAYETLGVKAAQYWSALVYRGPFAAAIIEHENAQLKRRPKHKAIQRESLA